MFLADASVLQHAMPFKPLVKAYKETFPEVAHRCFSQLYCPNRLLDHILTTDDSCMLLQLIDVHRRLTLEISHLMTAIDKNATQCIQVLLSESFLTFVPATADVRVRWDYTHQRRECFSNSACSPEAAEACVDFGKYPQRLLWRASLAGNSAIVRMLLLALSKGTAHQLFCWAACCGAFCGNLPLLFHCGPSLLARELARVTFCAPAERLYGVSEAVCFEDTPLAVVAASRGHVSALELIACSGVDLFLCTRRGLTTLDVVRRSKISFVAKMRMEAIILNPPCVWPSTLSSSNSRPNSKLSSTRDTDRHGNEGLALALAAASAAAAASRVLECSNLQNGDSSPVEAAILRGDVTGLRSLLERGAKLQHSNLMSAVYSGDLATLGLVQEELQSGSQAEYRKMMRLAAQQIRENLMSDHTSSSVGQVRRSGSLPQRPGSSSLRLVGAAALGSPSKSFF